MERELKFITCCPDDTYYTWQVHLLLENLKSLGKEKDAVILIFIPFGRKKNDGWSQIINLYPEATFQFYRDIDNEITSNLLPIYIPILRPWLMQKWFKKNPDYSEKAIFYCDSDILFMKDFNIDSYKDNDICYLSDTISYISANYLLGKEKDVLHGKEIQFQKEDILSKLGNIVGISKQQIIDQESSSGGAQYLLKNVDHKFWKKVLKDTISIRVYLQQINSVYFENESKGYQSWCADMWAVLWNLWLREQSTEIVKEMSFAWSTDPIEKLEKSPILHNAGVASTIMDSVPYFYKGKYHTGIDPTTDPHLDIVLNNHFSKKKCNWFYANELKLLKIKYNLKYQLS